MTRLDHWLYCPTCSVFRALRRRRQRITWAEDMLVAFHRGLAEAMRSR